jgi:hypothetical protein
MSPTEICAHANKRTPAHNISRNTGGLRDGGPCAFSRTDENLHPPGPQRRREHSVAAAPGEHVAVLSPLKTPLSSFLGRQSRSFLMAVFYAEGVPVISRRTTNNPRPRRGRSVTAVTVRHPPMCDGHPVRRRSPPYDGCSPPPPRCSTKPCDSTPKPVPWLLTYRPPLTPPL